MYLAQTLPPEIQIFNLFTPLKMLFDQIRLIKVDVLVKPNLMADCMLINLSPDSLSSLFVSFLTIIFMEK